VVTYKLPFSEIMLDFGGGPQGSFGRLWLPTKKVGFSTMGRMMRHMQQDDFREVTGTI